MEFKTSDYVWGVAVLALGLGMGLYNAGEILACLVLSSFLIFSVGLMLLGGYFAWHTGKLALARFAPEVPDAANGQGMEVGSHPVSELEEPDLT